MARSIILFDLDGTLVDSARDIAVALTRLSCSRGGAAVDPDTVRPLVSLGAAALVSRALSSVAGDPAEDLAAFRGLLRDLRPDPAIIFAGVEDALAMLIADRWRLAVVTNKPEALSRALLAGHRLDRFFAALVGGDTTAHPKPDAAPLRHALSLLDATPAEALFVGDSDIDAQAAGALAIPLLLYAGGYGASSLIQGHVAAHFTDFRQLPNLAASYR